MSLETTRQKNAGQLTYNQLKQTEHQTEPEKLSPLADGPRSTAIISKEAENRFQSSEGWPGVVKGSHSHTIEENKGNLEGLGRTTVERRLTEKSIQEPALKKPALRFDKSDYGYPFSRYLVKETLKELDRGL